MFLPDHAKLAAVDTLQELWSGKAPAHPCPVMQKLVLEGKDQVARGDTIQARVEASDPTGDPIKLEWALFREQANYNVEGTGTRRRLPSQRRFQRTANAR